MFARWNHNKEIRTYTCRSCINKKYHVKLKRPNCIYYPYQSKCPSCGKMRNIVSDLRFSGKLKMLFGKRPEDDETAE